MRFILPLFLVLLGVGYAIVPVVDALTFKWFVRDLDGRSRVIGTSIQDRLAELIEAHDNKEVVSLFNKVIQDERLYAVAVCTDKPQPAYQSWTFPTFLRCNQRELLSPTPGVVEKTARGSLHISVQPISPEEASVSSSENQAPPTHTHLGRLILVHDMSFVETRSEATKKYIMYLFLGLALIVSLITVVVAQLSWRGWMEGIRALLRGEGLIKPLRDIKSPELIPVARDLRQMLRDLESERRSREEVQTTWTSQTLRSILTDDLTGDEILIVSNREPYIHVRRGAKIEARVPASGLVTALEPVMRACSGTWIAHGSGDADREVVDKKDHVRVPPEHPLYQIRRVWLTEEEERGYYYGFSNEGLWPLCHIAHMRPTFRSSDWDEYVKINTRFAEAVFEEAKTEDPVVLVQDYHFALLPRLIRDKLPRATIITFWHIPWPNPESFGICPWREEIIDGLLGSSIMGFHTRFHCNNFLDTVDRFLEARIDRENSTISYGSKLTAVRNYPISIEWPSRWLATQGPVNECRAQIRQAHDLPPAHKLAVGIDRLDYTKGIIERFLAVERLLELHPEWIGQFSLIQIAAPSRSSIDQYQQFEVHVRALADKINKRFGRDQYVPIILKVEHHGADEVFTYYRASEVCMVTSLHDGMNLVAKEYVAARDDERGVLILSQFTGASRELAEALVVNPYNIDQCAMALHLALTMPEKEQRARMRSMRGIIQEYNVYRWAGRMLTDAARMRQRTRIFDKLKETQITLHGLSFWKDRSTTP